MSTFEDKSSYKQTKVNMLSLSVFPTVKRKHILERRCFLYLRKMANHFSVSLLTFPLNKIQ